MTRGLTPGEVEELRVALAHDLRTPLTVIAGYAELLQLRRDQRTHEEAPALILEAARRMSAEIDSLVERFTTEPALAEAPASPVRLGRPLGHSAGRHTILLVDDDAQLRRLLRATFPAEEFEIVEAADGREALDLIERERPDLVVLDWHLPVLSGAEVLEALGSRPQRPRVVVLTAFGEADPAGADAFLLKPFSPVELLDLIGQLVSGEPPER